MLSKKLSGSGLHNRTLIKDKLEAGQHSVIWDGADESCKQVGSGIYFYKLKIKNYEKTKKMILMK